MQEILLNVETKEIRYAYLKFGQVQDLIIERQKSRQITGNIYRGKVNNILHNIQSAFIDLNEGENGFIHISDIVENTKKFEEMFEMDFDIDYATSEKNSKNKEQDINKILQVDQPVLVQVVKEPIGTKGARLTSNISVAGRFLVLLPNTPHRGVSRKIEDRSSRDRLKKLIRSFEMPKEIGLICRTASASATADQLIKEAEELLASWNEIVKKFHQAKGPTLIYEESDIIKRAVMTAVEKKVDRILVDDLNTFKRCNTYYQSFHDEHPLKIELYRDKFPIFERFPVEREIDKALRRKVWLPSGGYLFLDRTEAMYTIDVNSGRSTQTEMKGNVEESLVRINLEAAEEIARQLRLRNIGGLIICDFIDMHMRKNQRRVLEKLKDFMKEDSAKCSFLGISEFGLVEMTRQRSRESLSQTLLTSCPYCSERGLIKSHETVAIEIERALKKTILYHQQYGLKLVTHPLLDDYLYQMKEKPFLEKLAEQENANLIFGSNDNLHMNDFQFYSTLNGNLLEL